MAADRGVTVRQVDIREDDVTLDLEDLESKLGPRTKLVAVGYASNAVGTINPVGEIVARAHEVGALTYIDAVAYAPHGPIDVQALDTDFLVTSVYKWFGPHLGALYGKAEVLDRCRPSRSGPRTTGSRPAPQSFESIAGTLAATDYLRDVGRSYGDVTGAAGAADASERRRELVAGMTAIAAYERELVTRLIDGLAGIPRVTDPRHHRPRPVRPARADRLGLHRGRPPATAAEALGARRRLRLGRRLLRDRAHRASRQGRVRGRPAARASSTTTPPPRSTGRSRRWSGSRRADVDRRGLPIRTDGRRPRRPPPGIRSGPSSRIRATPSAGWTIWPSSRNRSARRPDPVARPPRQRSDPRARARLVPTWRFDAARSLTAPSSSSRPASHTDSTTTGIGRCRCRRSSRRPGSGSATLERNPAPGTESDSPQAGATYDLRTGETAFDAS